MQTSLRSFVTCLLYGTGLIAAVSVLGCGGKKLPAGFPKLYPCTISINQEGVPLAGAVVKLHIQGNPLEWTVSGQTDDAGKAVIYTHGIHAGVPAGDFKVTVDKLETVAPPLPDQLPTDEDALARLYNKLEADTKEYRLVEPAFCKADSTTLTITVGTAAATATFDVGKKYREPAR